MRGKKKREAVKEGKRDDGKGGERGRNFRVFCCFDSLSFSFSLFFICLFLSFSFSLPHSIRLDN